MGRPRWAGRGAARAALRRWPRWQGESLRHITFGENATWRVTGPDGVAALRVYRPERWTNEQILVEHRLMSILGRETNVAPPLPGKHGETLQLIDWDWSPGHAARDCPRGLVTDGESTNPNLPLRAALFPWAAGRLDYRRVKLKRLEALGRYLGRIHTRLATVTAATKAAQSRRWDERTLVLEPLAEGQRRWQCEVKDQPFPSALVEWASCWAERLRTATLPAALLHADLHLGNVKWSAAGPAAIDFDDCGWAPLAYDLAIPALSAGAMRNEAILPALLSGYDETAPQPMDEALVKGFMVLRKIWELGWVSERPELFDPGELGKVLPRCHRTLCWMVEQGWAKVWD